MTLLQHIFLSIGALFGLLGVAAGAFGAHALKSKLPVDSLAIFEVAVRYQMYHALLLVALAALLGFFPSLWVTLAGWFFIAGVVIFSGSLYFLLFSGVRWWGAITPIGGSFLLLGWLALVLAAFFQRNH